MIVINKYRFLQNRKTSLSRDVSCRFELITVAMSCVGLGLASLGVGTGFRFLDDIARRNQQRRLKNRMIEIECGEEAKINRSQEIRPSREQVEKEFEHYVNTIEELCKNDPYQWLR